MKIKPIFLIALFLLSCSKADEHFSSKIDESVSSKTDKDSSFSSIEGSDDTEQDPESPFEKYALEEYTYVIFQPSYSFDYYDTFYKRAGALYFELALAKDEGYYHVFPDDEGVIIDRRDHPNGITIHRTEHKAKIGCFDLYLDKEICKKNEPHFVDFVLFSDMQNNAIWFACLAFHPKEGTSPVDEGEDGYIYTAWDFEYIFAYSVKPKNENDRVMEKDIYYGFEIAHEEYRKTYLETH